MIGADEDQYLASSKMSSRLISFPDGIPRHINLTNWHWEVLRRLHADKGWPEYEIPNAAFDEARQTCNDPTMFEQQLRHWLQLIIEASMADVIRPGEWNVANEPFPSTKPPINLRQVFSQVAVAPLFHPSAD